jgi:type I restriction enzyme R subunit
VQHSAGSGKTNSIAWTAHFLADLHDAKDQKVFDTVIVISDRTVLDDQLREAIMSFERTRGWWRSSPARAPARARNWPRRCRRGKKIVVCTIQTFPFALEEVRKLAATKGKRFAVIADEAHSSQTNETAAKLKMVLSAAEMAELQDGGDVSAEDILAAQMTAKAGRREGRHHLRGLHCHAQGQDAAAVRHAARPHAASRRPTTSRRPSTSTRCARPSRRASSSTC